MATVSQTQPTIQLLLKTSDFVGALDLIYTTQEVLQLELSGIHCLRLFKHNLIYFCYSILTCALYWNVCIVLIYVSF